MKKNLILVFTVVVMAIGGTIYAFTLKTECPLAGIKECPEYLNCPKKGQADCPLI